MNKILQIVVIALLAFDFAVAQSDENPVLSTKVAEDGSVETTHALAPNPENEMPENNGELCTLDYFLENGLNTTKMTAKEYTEQIYGDKFVATKKHVMLFKRAGMNHCKQLVDNLDKLGEAFSSDDLQINIIDVNEDEDLKLTFWAYLVPAMYIIDNVTESAIFFPTRYVLSDALLKSFEENEFQEGYPQRLFADYAKFHFKLGPVISAGPATIAQYILKDVRTMYNDNYRNQTEQFILPFLYQAGNMTNYNVTDVLIDPEHHDEFTRLYEQEQVRWGDRQLMIIFGFAGFVVFFALGLVCSCCCSSSKVDNKSAQQLRNKKRQ